MFFHANCRPRGPWFALLLLCAGGYAAVAASESPHPGHSMSGAAFDEGPRQAAYLMGGTGHVSLPVTSTHPDVQAFMDQGVGQLHGYWYYEAERSFRQAAALDPRCAMAYWGMAMANLRNESRAKKMTEAAHNRIEQASSHEKQYIDALFDFHHAADKSQTDRRRELIQAYEDLIVKHPADIEARAFLVTLLLDSKDHGIKIESKLSVDSLLTEIFAQRADHPAHHYRIHLWDDDHPERALASAAILGPSAPRIAHMWHMPGHTYSHLHRYADAVYQQEASGRVDHAYMRRDRVLPDQIFNYAHNQQWLAENLGHLGQARRGIVFSRNLLEIPRHPKFHGCAREGRARLIELANRFELYDELLKSADEGLLTPVDDVAQEAKRLRALARAAYSKGELPLGDTYRDQLRAKLEKTRDDQRAAGETAEKEGRDQQKPADQVTKAGDEARHKFDDDMQALERGLHEAEGHRARASGNASQALELFANAELRDKPLLSRVHLQAGEREKAEQLAEEAAKAGAHEVYPLATQVEVCRQCGKTDAAREAFVRLRTVAGLADLDVPPLQRLAPFARELGWPEDWRLPAPQATDLGERPDLAQLGPGLWHPPVAEDWTLPNAEGRLIRLSEYRGRPVLLVFYLGFGCVHCVEQLLALEQVHAQLQELQIEVLAIGTDPVDTVKQSLEAGEPRKTKQVTFLCDPELNVFKSYRSHDDFEHKALHGAFLIDGQGLVRWQDISFEPFTDMKFFVNEAQRLLKLSAPAALQASAP